MIINRTLVYGSLSAMLIALYYGGIVVLQRVFVLLTGQQSTGANRLFRPREREKLGPHDGLGPGYDADEARDAISQRCKNALALVQHALPRLVRDSRLCDRVALTRGHIFSGS